MPVPRSNLLPASFRGVPFGILSDQFETGRRTARHEFPGRDKPYIEDLGRRARTFAIEAFVVGDDYIQRRDSLLSALEEKGPGKLIHPYYGEMMVQIESVSVQHSATEGGMATFSIQCSEPGDIVFSISAKSQQAAVAVASAAVSAAAGSAYAAAVAAHDHR